MRELSSRPVRVLPSRMESRYSVQPTHVPASKKKNRGRINSGQAESRRTHKKRDTLDTKDLKPQTGAEVKVKSTVVDIDSVREEVREETLGLLEVAPDDSLKHQNLGVFEWLLMVFVLALVLLFLPISIWFCIKVRLHWNMKLLQVVREHERAVIFRLGHLLRGRPRGPGLVFYLPLLDVCHKVDIRLKMLKIPFHMVQRFVCHHGIWSRHTERHGMFFPPQAVTKDLVSVELTAVCYYQIENVALCSSSLCGLTSVLQNLVQTHSRDVLAQHSFGHTLQHRRSVGQQIQAAVDSVACRWGVRVDRADIEELTFPAELQQSLAAEAELKRQQQDRVKDGAVWETLRSSFRHLHPALVLPFPSDVFGVTPDLSCLPPPPPPSVMEEDPIKELKTDSSMM